MVCEVSGREIVSVTFASYQRQQTLVNQSTTNTTTTNTAAQIVLSVVGTIEQSLMEVPMKRPQILIADDHEITRIGVKSIISSCGAYDVCGEAADGRRAIEMVYQLKPDLLILDIGLPLLNGIEVARRLAVRDPRTWIVIFTEIDSEYLMLESIHSGVRGFMLKSDGVDELLAGVKAVLRGRTCFNRRVSQMLLDLARQRARDNVLSGREREVTQLIAEGHCSREIAESLAMSVKTVETHRSKIMHKLHIHTTAELTLYAVRNDIVLVEKPLQLAVIKQAPPSTGEPVCVDSAAAA
jgi:DNA-binding NarL/FixJ family response regulator